MLSTRIWGREAAKWTLALNLGLRNSSQPGFPASIIEKLFHYCQELDDDLDKKRGLAAKYFSVPPISLDPEAEQQDSQKRKEFLYSFQGTENPFYKFCQKLFEVIVLLQPNDIHSICTEYETVHAKNFRACVAELNAAGFYNVNGKPINFWSGEEAQELANTIKNSLSDSNVPAISILSHLGCLLKDSHRNLSDTVLGAGSAEFTGQATGDVIVYSSAANANEKVPLLTVGNFHWNVELRILQRLRERGIVKSIKLAHFVRAKNANHAQDSWFKKIGEWFNTIKFMDLSMANPAALPPQASYTDLKPLHIQAEQVEAMSLPCDTSYVDSSSPPCDTSYFDSRPFTCDTSYVDSGPFTCDSSYVDSCPLPCDTTYVQAPILPQADHYQPATEDESKRGHWHKPVDIEKVRLSRRVRSIEGTAEQKREHRGKWNNTGEERGFIDFLNLRKILNGWKTKAAERSKNRNDASPSNLNANTPSSTPSQSPSPSPTNHTPATGFHPLLSIFNSKAKSASTAHPAKPLPPLRIHTAPSPGTEENEQPLGLTRSVSFGRR